MKITKTSLERITLPATANGKPSIQFFRDDELTGFGLRVSSSGSKAFFVEKRVHGKVRRVTLGQYPLMTCEQARIKALAQLSDMAQGIDPIEKKQAQKIRELTLQDVFDDYLITHPRLTPHTVKDYRRHLKESYPDWLNKRITDINKDMVARKHRELSLRSHARADNAMRVLRALMNHAMARYDDKAGNPILMINPVSVLSRTRAWNPRKRKDRYIKPHQLGAWYQATLKLTQGVSRDYFLLLLFTGLRKSEAVRLKWEDVDFKDRTFTARDTKNRRDHTLPMSDLIFDLFSRCHAVKQNEWVFPSNHERGHLIEPKSAMRRITELSGIEFSFHDLRRTFITIAESLDISHYALKRLLNHKDNSDVTAGYIILDIERLREPMERISQRIESFIKCNPDDSNIIDLQKRSR